mgnify:CR=1 FL=1
MSGCKSDEEREFYIKLCIKENYSKRQLKDSLTVDIMKDFILELGKDFTFIDEEYRVQVGGETLELICCFS